MAEAGGRSGRSHRASPAAALLPRRQRPSVELPLRLPCALPQSRSLRALRGRLCRLAVVLRAGH
eukprot:1025010-Lingulodinium_polyedra.AAC.1